MPFPSLYITTLQPTYGDYASPSHAASTTLDLFAREMKYLHDNGFRVLGLNQLEYDPNNNVFYIKEIG